MKLFLLETFLLTIILPCLVTVELYCPTGNTFLARPRHAMREFERHCQCAGGALCRYTTQSLGCSTVLGSIIEKRYHHLKVSFQCKVDVGRIVECSLSQSACIIHDICYGSLKPGRSRQDCDLEFRHNLIKLCRPSKILFSRSDE